MNLVKCLPWSKKLLYAVFFCLLGKFISEEQEIQKKIFLLIIKPIKLKVEGMSIIFYMYCVANFYDQLKYQSMLHKKSNENKYFFNVA